LDLKNVISIRRMSDFVPETNDELRYVYCMYIGVLQEKEIYEARYQAIKLSSALKSGYYRMNVCVYDGRLV
jgi:hypothetical protein